MPWMDVTNLGDSAVMVPAILAIALWLLSVRAWPAAVMWIGLTSLAQAVVLVSKLAFLGWGMGIAALDFTGISGHSMFAVTVYTASAFLLGIRLRGAPRLALVLCGCLLGLTVAASRVVIHVHSVAEIVAGTGLGLTVLAGCIAPARGLRAESSPRVYLLAAMLGALLGLLHGHRAPTEGVIARLALALSGHRCVYTRADFSKPACPGLSEANAPAPRPPG